MLSSFAVMLRPILVAFLYQCSVILRYGRGQRYQTPPSQPTPTVPNLWELWQKEVEKMQREYNPNPGYEPYWPQGGWVHEPDELTKQGSTTKMQLVCGEECNYLYKEVQHVCARRVDWQSYWGRCEPYLLLTCFGDYVDDLTPGFRTFDTYCEFLDTQCRANRPYNWVLVHRGKCVVPQDEVFKTVGGYESIRLRLQRHLSTLSDVFRNASLPSPL